MIEEKTAEKSQPPLTTKNDRLPKAGENHHMTSLPSHPPLPPSVSAPPLPPNSRSFGQRHDSFTEELPGSNHLDNNFDAHSHEPLDPYSHPPEPPSPDDFYRKDGDLHRNRSNDRHGDRDRNRRHGSRDSRAHYDDRDMDKSRGGDRRDRYRSDRHHNRRRRSRDRDADSRYDDHVPSRDSRDSRKSHHHSSHYRSSRYMDDRDRDHRRRSRDHGDEHYRRRHDSSDYDDRRDVDSEEEGEVLSEHRDTDVSLPPEPPPPPEDAIPEPPPPDDDAPVPPEPDADVANDEPRLDLDSRIQSLLGGFQASSPEREPENHSSAPPLPPGGDAPPLPPNGAPPLPSDPPPMPPAPGVNGSLDNRLTQFSKVFMSNGVGEDDRMSLSSGNSGDHERIELHPNHMPPLPMPPPPMGMPPMPPPLPMWSNANSSNQAFPGPIPPHPMYSHGFMPPHHFLDPHQQALLQQRQLETFTDLDRDAEKTFRDVLEEVIDQLKVIMKKDLCKKMLQGTAFKTFDSWYEREMQKKNQVRGRI